MSNRVIAEYNAGELTKYYVWGPFDRLLSMTLEGITYYPVYNGRGDIVQLRDAGGNLVAWYQYDAWGNLTDHSKENEIWSKNPYRYASYRYDDVTGLYYLMARYYDPQVGRFISQDPLFQSPEYAYSENNPIVYKDPTGLAHVHSQEGGGGGGRSNSSGGAVGGSTSVGFNGKNVSRALTEQEQLSADKAYMRHIRESQNSNSVDQLKNVIKSSQRIDNRLEKDLPDGTKIVFRKDLGAHAHPINPKYPSPVEHYNIELHKKLPNGRFKQTHNFHIINGKDGNVIENYHK